eukprot:jgi/Mesen1/9458/ME000627S08845
MQQTTVAEREAAGGPVIISRGPDHEDESPAAVIMGHGRSGGKGQRPQGGLQQQPCWFDVRVIYVRVSAALLDDDTSPESLVFKCPSRDISTNLEVNGARIAPSEEAMVLLRRDRVSCDSAEATYVSTDNLRADKSVSFEVYVGDESILAGTLHHAGSAGLRCQPGSDSAEAQVQSGRLGWTLDCACCMGEGGCAFLKGKQRYATPMVQPSVEVCIVGRYRSSPVILTETVKLTCKRKKMRRGGLDAIPEADEADWPIIHAEDANLLEHEEVTDSRGLQILEERLPAYAEKHESVYGGFYHGHGPEGGIYGESDEGGELSWFNAGVRVGVGIGLGMCIGVGIGVGLLVRTYQTTARSFRRGFL